MSEEGPSHLRSGGLQYLCDKVSGQNLHLSPRQDQELRGPDLGMLGAELYGPVSFTEAYESEGLVSCVISFKVLLFDGWCQYNIN